MTFADLARGTVRVRRAQDGVPVDVTRRLTQHLRRLDEHRGRIEYVERTVDDLATELGYLSSRLAAVERRLVELHVAGVVTTSAPNKLDVAAEPISR